MISALASYLIGALIPLLIVAAITGLVYLCRAIAVLRARLYWMRTLREVVRTDARMLGDAFRLSLAHFQAINELRKLGGRR